MPCNSIHLHRSNICVYLMRSSTWSRRMPQSRGPLEDATITAVEQEAIMEASSAAVITLSKEAIVVVVEADVEDVEIITSRDEADTMEVIVEAVAAVCVVDEEGAPVRHRWNGNFKQNIHGDGDK